MLGYNKSNTDETLLEPISPEACILKATELIPETLRLRNDGGSNWVYWGAQQWKDGTGIDYFGTIFYGGEKTGQDINYYYIDIESKSLTYYKQLKDDDNTILGTRTFSMRPLLKPIEGTRQSHKTEYLVHSTQEFEIVKPNFIECDWFRKSA